MVRAVDVINLDAKYRLRKYMPGAELKKKGRLLYDVSTESVIEKEREQLSGKPEIPVEEYNQEKKFAARGSNTQDCMHLQLLQNRHTTGKNLLTWQNISVRTCPQTGLNR